MKTRFLIILTSLMMVISGCQKEVIKNVNEPKQLLLPSKATEVIARSNDFGIELFRSVAQSDDENLMLSPLSASTALTMLLNGCSGETYNQIRDMLGFAEMTLGEINNTYRILVSQLLEVDPDVELALANAIWYREQFTVHASFLDTMDNAFKAHIEALDFNLPSALSAINGWAADNTNGKIDKVLDKISTQAVMFLMNALYFKGTWTYQFDKDQTANAPFYLDDGSTVSVPMMKGHFPAKTYGDVGYSAIELPYGRQNFSMVIIVPGNTLADFLEGFNEIAWSDLTDSFDAMTEPTELDIMIPKFKFDYEKKLNNQLKDLGMVDAFIPYIADLSGISDASIFVSFVKQNTFVDVNEEGTEAAAVTTIGVELTSIQSFEANKPFIFAIRERTTNTILFLGKVEKPEY